MTTFRRPSHAHTRTLFRLANSQQFAYIRLIHDYNATPRKELRSCVNVASIGSGGGRALLPPALLPSPQIGGCLRVDDVGVVGPNTVGFVRSAAIPSKPSSSS